MKIEIKDVCMSFGAENVLDGVNLCINGGEIHALLGENGAGKSTLMNIVGGILKASSGDIFVDGNKVKFYRPSDSLKAGIAFIHQELNIINDLTVYENMYVGNFPIKNGMPDIAYMKDKTSRLFEKLGIDIDPCALAGSLDASYKQIVEISRAMLSNAKIIIMDEPTSSLNAPEIKRIFSLMRTLKEEGVGIVFISHKLDEVIEICDCYTVLRNGIVAGYGTIDSVTSVKLAELMVGHTVEAGLHKRYIKKDNEILRLENLTDRKTFFDISLSVSKGEILGITGLLGDGRSELFSTIFGAHGKKYYGEIYIHGKKIHPKTTGEALKNGIAYLPKNRKENAVMEDMSILDNGTTVSLKKFAKGGIINDESRKSAFEKWVKNFSIKIKSVFDGITGISGGNQQKVILTKYIMANPDIVILNNPTQGVDVGAKEEIYSIIEQLAEKGMTIIILSSEAKEIIRMCNRVIVMYHGKTNGEITGENISEKNIMYLATGANTANERK